MNASLNSPVPKWKIMSAYGAVYLLWGSTYLAIRIAIETLPPFLMAGIRFVIAGTLLYVWARLRGAPRPLKVHWRSAVIVGALLLLGGNGGVVWSEQFVTSGIAALLVATVPLWMSLLQILWKQESRPSLQSLAGILLGFSGIWFLAAPNPSDIHGVPLWAAAVLTLAALSWAAGSLLTRHLPLPDSSSASTGMEMIAGGICLLFASLLSGEPQHVNFAEVSFRSWLALTYLVVFGALVGFSCYIWIVKVTPPALSSTYAYINPVVAVFLGWMILGEPLTPRILTGAAVIIAAVFLITTAGRAGKKTSPQSPR